MPRPHQCAVLRRDQADGAPTRDWGKSLYRHTGRARARHKISTIGATITAATLGVMLAGGGAAAAAEFDYPSTIDPASITVKTLGDGGTVAQFDQLRVDAAWAVPDGAVGGQTFGLTLPAEFARSGLTFSVPSKTDPGTAIAECAVSDDAAPVVTCTLTDYVNGRTDVSGSLWFLVSADQQTTQSTVEFVVNGKARWVEVPGGGIVPAAAPPVEPQKWSWQTDDGRIAWELSLPGASFDGAESIVIDDALTPAGGDVAEHHNEDGQFVVWSTDANDEDFRTITDWTGEWNAEGTAFHLEIPGPVDPTRVYAVEYFTVPSSHAEGATFSNVADINGVTVQDKEVWQVTGGGIGDGYAPGAFTLSKTVDGTGASAVPADAEYTVRYSYGDPVVEKTVAVVAGGTTAPISLPAGTVVTVEELTPPALTGIEWGAPVFSGTGVSALADGGAQFTVNSGTTLAVGLANTATTPPVVPPTVPPTPPTAAVPPPELPLTDRGELATTGADAPIGYLWAGGAAVLLGIAVSAFAAARSRSRQSQA